MKKSVLPRIVVVVVWSLVFGFSGLSQADQTNLTGTVWNARTMLPVPGLNVVLENDAQGFTAITDEDGAYEFQGIPQGTYNLYVEAPEYYRVERQIAVGDATGTLDIVAIPVDIFDAKASDPVCTDIPTAFTGTWGGTWRGDWGGSGALTLRLTSQSAKLKGTLTVTKTDCGTVSGPFVGSFNSSTNKLSGHATATCRGSYVRVTVKGTKTGNTVKGQYWNNVDGSLYDKGTYTLKKR